MKRILLAEDGRGTQAVLRQVLESEGFEVHAVANGREALQALTHQSFHAAILDVGLPDVSGVDVLRHVLTSGLRVPVIVISGRADEAIKAVGEGAHGYLIKPFTFEALRDQISRLV